MGSHRDDLDGATVVGQRVRSLIQSDPSQERCSNVDMEVSQSGCCCYLKKEVNLQDAHPLSALRTVGVSEHAPHSQVEAVVAFFRSFKMHSSLCPQIVSIV